jgi:hypothetical protein
MILNHVRDNSADHGAASLFIVKISTAIHTLNFDLPTSHLKEFYEIPLEVRGCSSLVETLAKFVEPQLLPMTDPYFRPDQSTGIEFMEVSRLRGSMYNHLTGK